MEYSEDGRRSTRTLILLTVLVGLLVILGTIAVWLGWSYYGGAKTPKKSVLTVTFDCNADESELDYEPEAQSVAYGETATCPAFPTRTDYAFEGWYTDAACTSVYDFSTAVTKDLTLYADWVDLDSEEAQITETEYEIFLNCLDTFSEIYNQYADADGYVPEGQTSGVIAAVSETAEQYREQGIITYYNAEESTVYMEFASCMTYLFSIPEEGTDGDPTVLESAAVFPFYGVEWAYDDSALVDSTEDDVIEQVLETISNTETYTGSSVSWQDGFGYLEGCDILVWHGHGEYCSDLGPILATSESISKWTKAADELGLTFNSVYQQLNRLCCEKVVTLTGVEIEKDGEKKTTYVYALTPSYFNFFLPDLDGAFVYLAACHSGQDSRLADAFLAAGAEVVLANAGTDSINTGYNLYMVENILNLMADGATGYPGYYTVQESLDLMASLGYGYDVIGNNNAYPEIFYASGNEDAVNYTLWAGLTGTITSDDNIDMSQVKVVLYNTTEWTRIGTVTPSSDGSFSFDQLDGGDSYAYSLHVTYQGETVVTENGLHITAHRYLDLGEISLGEDGGLLSVRVVDEEGGTISGASVRVGGISLGMTGAFGSVSKYFLNGTYTIIVAGPDGYEDGIGTAIIAGQDITVTVTLESESTEEESSEEESDEEENTAEESSSEEESAEESTEGSTEESTRETIVDSTEAVEESTTAESETTSAIPEDATEYNGHHYYIYDVGHDAAAAIAYCESLGGHMATITSEGENSFLYNYMISKGYQSVYFGLSDAAQEGTWRWVNGESVTYTNWHSGEPNNEFGVEDYGMFYWKYTDGTWNDGDLESGLTNKGGSAFLCEWDW